MDVLAQRIAICQHPNGEGVWWDVDAHPHEGCIQECDCTPVVYVRADLHAGALEALREIVHRAETPCAPHEPPLPYDVAWAEQVAIAKAALDQLGGQ